MKGPVVSTGPFRHAGAMSLVRRSTWAALLMAVALALGGCGTSEPDEPAPDDTAQEEPTKESPVPSTDVVQAAVDDLAAQEGVDTEEIEVVAVEEVTWNNGSLGCAAPDMAYTQALVPGQRITLRLGGKEFAYHSGNGEPPFYCPEPTQ